MICPWLSSLSRCIHLRRTWGPNWWQLCTKQSHSQISLWFLWRLLHQFQPISEPLFKSRHPVGPHCPTKSYRRSSLDIRQKADAERLWSFWLHIHWSHYSDMTPVWTSWAMPMESSLFQLCSGSSKDAHQRFLFHTPYSSLPRHEHTGGTDLSDMLVHLHTRTSPVQISAWPM